MLKNLTGAFYSVSVALEDQNYLFFRFDHQLYKYVCLPNGLSCAGRIYTKILKLVISALIKRAPDYGIF